MSRSAKDFIPAGYLQIRENVANKDNLTGVTESKALWAKDLNFPKQAEFTLFAACGYQQMKYVEGMTNTLKNAGKIGMGMGKAVGINKAFQKVGVDLTNLTARITAGKDDPYTPVLLSAVSVLRRLGIDVGYLQEQEPCCGSPLYYSGFGREYVAHARKNYEIFKSLGVKKMIGVVPACTSALKNVYPEYVQNYDLEVQHILQIIASKLQERGSKPKVQGKVTVTYHDPCQLSRYLGIIQEPRDIIRSIEGVELVEPEQEACGKWSSCCGGGGLETTHPELAERVGARRIDELLKTGASMILTNCPACEMQLAKAIRRSGTGVEVVDLVKFLDEVLDSTES